MDYQKRAYETLARLVKYNSEQGEALPGKPFGEGPAACLEEALKCAGELGFRTVNMENYCGYAEIGEGEDIIGIVGHLDIVPAGEDWDTDPFTLTFKDDGRVYGRGVSDDKGACAAAMYAMKKVADSGIPLTKRVRLLMGCNEESGSKCMEYYREHGEPITVGFTPDANFPGIYGEKGGFGGKAWSKNTKIIDLKGGTVSNAVCSKCTIVIPAEVSVAALTASFMKTPLTSYDIKEEDGKITIFAQGVAAHASMPYLGVNAANWTFWALKDAGFEDDFVDFFTEHFGTDNDGAGIGLKISDEYGDLTCCNGVVGMEDGKAFATIDCRCPVTYSPDQIKALVAPYLEDEKGYIEARRAGKALFFDPNSELVTKLVSAYREVTGDYENQPEVIGGGTYAKSIPGIIAFGCEFPGANNHIHDANESLPVEEMGLQIDIYRKAIEKLLS